MNGRPATARRSNARWLLLAGAGVIIGIATAVLFGYGQRPDVAPRAELSGLTPDGRAVETLGLGQHFKLLAYGYTSCPEACPATLTKLHLVLDTLGPDVQHIVPIFVTLDPAHDTPALLDAYVRHFDTHIVGLSGTTDDVRRSAVSLGALPADPAAQSTPDGGPNHAVRLYLLGPDNALVRSYELQDPTRLVAQDIGRRIHGG